MPNYQFGELLPVDFPYSAGAGFKHRPALVLIDNGDADILIARVTSQPGHTSFDFPIAEWRQAGLLTPSTARLHKLTTAEKQTVTRRIGTLTRADLVQLRALLAQIWTTL